jgi:hypothetical protein
MAAKLHAVGPDDKPQAKKKQSVAEAAATGDQLATLIATRDRIAVAISDPKCSPRDLAALTKRLDDIIEKIKTLEGAEDEPATVTDDGYDASAI